MRLPRSLLLTVLCLLATLSAGACGSTAASPTTAPAGSRQATPAGSNAVTITAARRRRTLYVYAYGNARAKRPLVLVYHGADESAKQAQGETDFVAAAKAHGLIVAFMQGYQNTWNEGAGGTPARRAGVDDVAFTSAAIAWLEHRYRVDSSRVAAAGFSNGALMTQLLGCRIASRLTLIVPLEGQLPSTVSPGCRPSSPISVLEFHGTADSTIPYNGGHFDGVGGGTTVLSAPASAARWASLNHCSRTARTVSGSTRATNYTGCHRGVVVSLRTIAGGTHFWPTGIGEQTASFLLGHPRG